MNTAQKRKQLTKAYALATELLEIAKESAAAAAEAVAKFEGQPDEEEDFHDGEEWVSAEDFGK